MIKVLFVCHGNICRSPMAQYIFADLTARRGFGDKIMISSAACTSEELGNPIYPPAAKTLDRHMVPIGDHRATKLRRDDGDNWDLLVGMDEENRTMMNRIIGPENAHKIHLLLEYAGQDREVEDPWWTGNYEKVYNDILDGCEGLLSYLEPYLKRG